MIDFHVGSDRGEDARAPVPNQQVRPTTAGYPVDRYLVESSNKIDMVNLIDDGIWNPEPMLNPEDEIILRKLHDMLQSTADDLKLLSGELSRYHEKRVQVKTLPTPLDEEFNVKNHIEEIVNTKFHDYKIVDSIPPSPNIVLKDSNNRAFKANANKTKSFVDTSIQVNYMPTLKNHTLKRNLGISRTKIVQIDEKSKKNNEIKGTSKISTFCKKKMPAVVYNELSYKYIEPKIATSNQKPLQIQDMPSINIRSELTKQKVLQLDIIPENQEVSKNDSLPSNALVLTMHHEPEPKPQPDKSIAFNQIQQSPRTKKVRTVRKVSKMSTCESSEYTNNISSDSQQKVNERHYIRPSPKISLAVHHKGKNVTKKFKRSSAKLEEWNKKLNAVYGRPKQITKLNISKKTKTSPPSLPKQSKLSKNMNNFEYVPYTKLTLGGVNVSDIEKEICDIPNRNDINISPILDRILNSRENSFHNESPLRKQSPKVLTTSDENLLQEVIDIEYKVSKTLPSKAKNTKKSSVEIDNISKDNKESDSYIDDFEDEKTEEEQQSQSNKSQPNCAAPSYNNSLNGEEIINKSNENSHNNTYTKTTNLSFKNAVDVFEFVHSIDTQDIGTQSNATNISPKEIQTSPRIENPLSNLKPIHNDLWTIDSKKEVERMLNLEKDFIKKLILEEYGDLLHKNTNKPSTSKSEFGKSEINKVASAKKTQTSPAHVKNIMTSPTRTKTRTTSPFALSVSVNQQTSPMSGNSKEKELKVQIGDDDELGISVNLSSPRFSLRLPQTSREVISNFEADLNNKANSKDFLLRKSSSSSLNENYSSSDISSLGQMNRKSKRKLRKSRIPSISELSSSSTVSVCSSEISDAVLPLRSEGEASLGLVYSKKSNRNNRSEGELSLGQYN